MNKGEHDVGAGVPLSLSRNMGSSPRVAFTHNRWRVRWRRQQQ
jgi:hypothetical protein